MGKQAKRAYLEVIRGRYRKANRTGKVHILDEFCAACGYTRNCSKPSGGYGRHRISCAASV